MPRRKTWHLVAPWSMACEYFVLLRKAASRDWLDARIVDNHIELSTNYLGAKWQKHWV
jgi:hypothetical protein